MKQQLQEIQPGRKPLKRVIVGLVFWFLGRGFQAAAELDPQVAGEVSQWAEGTVITLKVSPKGPAMSMRKVNGRLRFLGLREADDAAVVIYFKNLEGALSVLLAQIGIAQAYAEHRFGLKGDLHLGMSLVRSLYIVEAHLFPEFMKKSIFKRQPRLKGSTFQIYIKTLTGVK